MGLTHAFSVDVEDWTSGVLSMWFGKEAVPGPNVVSSTERLLEMLAANEATATWFFLGDVAEAHPGLVRRIVEAGQEVGIHGLKHTPIWAQTPRGFAENLRRARDVVEQAGGARVLGHRAPTFSIGPATPWAFEVLAECGFAYDSSIFPFRGKRYGDPTASLVPWRVETPAGPILEVPLSVVRLLGRRVPTCGGGYLRHFPAAVTLAALRRLTREGRPAVLFVHPYELDSRYEAKDFSFPLPAGRALRYRIWRALQYRNRGQTGAKLARVLREFRFRAVSDVFAAALPAAGPPAPKGIEP